MRKTIEFQSQGNTLRGLLEYPDRPQFHIALFAHCFTCGKDSLAASRITKALVEKGIAVLRFDFTGLGNSEGDFANSHFSSNVEDLLAAARYLKQHYTPPKLLIGHSLGGAAVLMAANRLDEAAAVVTIGAPSNAAHVKENFSSSLETIANTGKTTVTLGSREFTITQEFIDDLDSYQETIKDCTHKALLILHSPFDSIVPISEAEKLYFAAKHPKSFISLDRANHLLTNQADAEYAARTLACWAEKYLPRIEYQPETPKLDKGHILVEEKDHQFLQRVVSDNHSWLADEPVSIGGKDMGPDPYEHLLAALGACTSMTVRLYARRKKWPLENVRIHLEHSREHSEDCLEYKQGASYLDIIKRNIYLAGPLSKEQKQRLIEIANLCPIHKTLHNKIIIKTQLSSDN